MKINFNYYKKHNGKYMPLRMTGIYLLVATLWVVFFVNLLHSLEAGSIVITKWFKSEYLTFIIFTTPLIFIVAIFLIRTIKKAEIEIDKKEKELQLVLDSVPTLIWYKDTHNRFLNVNKKTAEAFGINPEEIEGKTSFEIFPEDSERFYDDDLEVIKTGKPKFDIIQRVSAPNGEIIWVQTDKIPNRNAKGEITGLLEFARIITDHIKMEEEIRQKSYEQEVLLNTIPATVFFKDKNLNYIAVNKAFADFTGIPLEDIPGKSDFELFSQDLAEAYQRDDSEVLETGQPKHNIIEKSVSKDGKTLWFATYKSPYFDSNGDIKGIVGISIDVTDRKLVEEELMDKIEENTRLLEEVMEYDKLKTIFFSNISHEFKTPLNVLLSTLQLIESYRNKCSKKECSLNIDRFSTIMRQNCFRLLKLINNLIDLTKIDSGFISMNLENCNIVSLVEEATMSVAEYIQNHGISLEFDTEIEERMMACDADKIERILLNLLSNAIKFTKPGGSIWVKIKERENSIIISVKDSGIGIPKDKLKVIFERFRQVNLTLARDHEGSGIGLSLVKSMVEMHGGSIKAESEPGKGSEFIVEIPISLLPNSNNKDINKEQSQLADIEFSDIY